jgi:hypothetical protein
MAKPAERLQVWDERVQGGKLVKTLQRHVENLRDENPHGNRGLFLDDVFVAYLLAFFNPSIRSLRVIEDFSQTVQAQRHLTTQRICRSTLSDFNKIADPQRLNPIIAELRKNLDLKSSNSQVQDGDLYGLLQQVLAVDGTFFEAAADVVWAVGHRNQHSKRYRARVDVSIDIHTWLPEVMAIPDPGEGEAHRAAQTVKPGAIHIYDRGFGSFDLLTAHYKEDSKELRPIAEFVLRGKTNQLHFTATKERELTAKQRQQRIVSDRIGFLDGLPQMTVREVIIRTESGEEIRLLTNLLEIEAEVIGELYKRRWQIELFFRWLKCYANFNHLISHSREGLLLNFYVVIIGVMLMYLHTSGRPSKYAVILLGMVAQSGGDLESILPILRERERQCEVARKSAAARRARKKAESR